MRAPAQLRRDVRMLLSRRLNRSLAPPDRVSVNVTLRCNLTCSMCTTCYDAPELSTDEIKGIIDQTADWGVEVFNPLGGEPFIRSDMEELLAYAVQRGFYVTVTTNGTLLTEKRARALAAIPTDRLHLNLSLDGDAHSNDLVRGAGKWARAIAGYQRVRAADAAAGNPRRKILANTILHAANLDHFEAVLDEQAALGFDGVRVLNLFRQGDDVPAEAANLWLRERHMARLAEVAEALAVRAEGQGPSGYRIQNPPDELRFIPRYYTEQLEPLDAPCWAGWKELYINADGAAIMCDGELDFLAGSFGNAREQTLKELWHSPALRERRRVVKQCATPCIQDCYLRGSSDSAAALGADAARLAARRVTDRIRRLNPRVEHVPDGVLRLELSDVCPCDWEGCTTPPERWAALTRGLPERPHAGSWTRLRDHGHVDFGRGFLGFELVRQVVSDLLSARLRFGTLCLSWRGDPLLHPEIEPILRYLLDHIHRDRLADRLCIETSGAFLGEGVAALAAHPAPQEWFVDLDRGDGAGLALLESRRGPGTRIVRVAHAVAGLDAAALVGRHPGVPVTLGRPPEGSDDALWIRRTDHGHFQATAAARAALQGAADDLGRPLDPADRGDEGAPRWCQAPARTPTVSWDGKVTLCPWDTQLENRVGDVCEGPLSETWRSDAMRALRHSTASQGVPALGACRDCPSPWSPNHGR